VSPLTPAHFSHMSQIIPFNFKSIMEVSLVDLR